MKKKLKEKTIKKIKKETLKNYLLNDMKTLKGIVSQINGENSSLDWLEYYDNDEYFFDIFFKNKPSEVASAVCYGDYRPCDELVKFNGYGNLESKSIYGYEKELKEDISEIVDALIHTYDCVENDIDDKKLKSLIEEVLNYE